MHPKAQNSREIRGQEAAREGAGEDAQNDASRPRVPSQGLSSPRLGDRQSSPAVTRPASPRPDPFLRAENEDDDGYDPYSDRPATPEPLFVEDPWR